MVCLQRRIQQSFPFVLSVLLSAAAQAHAQQFVSDDPLLTVPEVASAQAAKQQDIDALYDFIMKSAHYKTPQPTKALGINTLGEVPDSSWYNNEHVAGKLSREELKRGPRTHGVPQTPFTVVAAKTEGVTPGFRIQDSRGLTYFVKVDPPSNPEMATGADVVGALFLYAAGYNVPENYILTAHREEFHLSDTATITQLSGKKQPMTQANLRQILDKVPIQADGRIRVMASAATPGNVIGPFRYEGTRSDDPNDLIPHQQRRDLRGLAVIFAWINHTDAKGDNSLDTVVGKGSDARIVHHLLDFGDSFGSDSDIAKDPRHGQEFELPVSREQRNRALTLGLHPTVWETAHYPRNLHAVGNFTAEGFDPLTWKPNYPNPAFLAMLPDDAYWGARRVMLFSDDDIRAIVEEGQFSDPAVVTYITRTLIARRDAVGRAWLTHVPALEDFRIEASQLQFTDLDAKSGLAPKRSYHYSWFSWDNVAGSRVLTGEGLESVPSSFDSAAKGAYIGCTITDSSVATRSATVYFERGGGGWTLVGVSRTGY